MNTLIKRTVVALLALTALTTVAANRNVAGYFCIPVNDAVGYSTPTGQGLVTTASPDLFCPLLDDSGQVDRGLATIMTLNVRVNDRDANKTMQATACVQFFGVDGVACGSTVGSGVMFIGTANLSPTTTVWHTFFADFAYVLVNSCVGCKTYGYRVTQ